MLVSAWDESEAQNPRDVYTVASCLSTCERWEAFRRAWQKALGPGVIFHATEWEHGKKYGTGPFAHLHALKPSEVRARERRLRWIIAEHCLFAVASSGAGTPVVARWADVLAVHDDPYIDQMFICLAVMHFTKDRTRPPVLPREPIRCMFERRGKSQDRRLYRQYERITEQWFKGGFGTSVIGKKEDPEMAPLQAADFLAHYTMKEGNNILDWTDPLG